jgi:hypothetical protein
MAFFVEGEELQLPGVDPEDTIFNNLFIGSERSFSFESDGNRYSLFLKQKNLGLDPKILFKIKIAQLDAAIILSGTILNPGEINKKFANINLMLFDDDIKNLLLNCLFESELSSFSAKIGLDIQLHGAVFGDFDINGYDKEIGVNIVKNESQIVTFNLLLNDDLLKILNERFKELPATKKEVADDLQFEWYLEVGKTNLSIDKCQILEEQDIVFFDEDASVRAGKYEIKGLGDTKLIGQLAGSSLVVESGNF